MSARSLLALAVLLAAGASSGCDNPACVFAGTCQDGLGGSGDGSGPAGGLGEGTLPPEGSFLSPAAPQLVGAAPADGATLANVFNDAPVFVQFSESLDPDSLENAFVLFDLIAGVPIPTLPPQLVGDGRVAVLLTLAQLSSGRTYRLVFSEEQKIRDLNGQPIEAERNETITTFTIGTDPDSPPRAFYVYPNDFSTTDVDTSEIVVGFDRAMESASVNDSSFVVTVDGNQPAFDPAPAAFSSSSFPGAPTDTRVWTWTPRDADGRTVPYGTDARVLVELSPAGAPIRSAEGEELPATVSEFRTLQFTLPAEVRKPVGALPSGAYGRADVFGPSTLLEVDLTGPAPSSTSAEIFLFGTSPSNSFVLRSTSRSVDLTEGATSFSATAEDLGLLDGLGDPQFLDGSLTIGVSLRRNTLRSAVRLLDGDPSTPALDPFTIDTTPPTLLGLGATGGPTSTFASGVSDLVITGRASEPVSFAFVDAGGLGDNGGSVLDPPRTAFTAPDPGTDEALFVAAAVPVGRLDPNGAAVTYDVTIYDEALNASPIGAVGTFSQVGVVGPGDTPTGGTVRVRVLDATTLQPLRGVDVYSHQELGGAVDFVASATTGIDGRVSVAGAAEGATLITAEAPTYDLTTFHGVPRDAIDILIRRTAEPGADVSGTVESAFPEGNFLTSTNAVADSRAPRLERLAGLEPGIGDGTRYRYDFGPAPIRPGAVGALSFLATEQGLPQLSWNAAVYLRGFALASPLAPQAPGGSGLDVVLDAGTQLILSPIGLQALTVPPHVLSTAGLPGLGAPDGDPRVTVEAAATGLDAPIVVGRGIPYAQGGGTYAVLAAGAGLAGPAGELVGRRAIEADLFLRAAVRDAAGNEVAARPRLSGSGSFLSPIGVPRLLSPAPGGSTGSPGFNLLVSDTLSDVLGLEGVVRAVLTDGSMRRWEVLGLDTSDVAGSILLSVPDLGPQGGTGLEAGTVSVEVTLHGGPFDRAHFLYSDLERFHSVSGYAAPVTILVP
ncbi:MAG: Ig-like domain-containing protein [Planctomycetota bacterium]|nr:Ig-like domain-containing protein [Planctomycetota bacterium]